MSQADLALSGINVL